MKTRAIVTVILALFVAVSVVYLIAKETRDDRVAPDRATGTAGPGASHADTKTDGSRAEDASIEKVIVYYFHGTTRCPTCRKIEAYAEEAIRTNFGSDLASGRLEWHAVNVDEPDNSHFVQDYQLVTRSLVLVAKDGTVQTDWKNLDKVWQLVGSKPEFTDYVVKSTREFMAGGNG